MSIAVVFAIYFILWWLSLLIVLPWGAHSQDESGDITPGTDPGAPSMHRVKGKIVWATLIATVLFGILWAAYAAGLIPADVIAAINGPHS